MKSTTQLTMFASFVYCVFASGSWEGTTRTTEAAKAQWPSQAKLGFTEALSAAAKESKGKPLEIKLEEERGFLVYEVTVIDTTGAQTELILDAGNGKVLNSKADD